MQQPLISLSVVSHGQCGLVRNLLADLDRLPPGEFEIIITSNVPEDTQHYVGSRHPVTLIENAIPKGFGANHNAAFQRSRGRYFAVVNPDIRLTNLDFQRLLAPFGNSSVGAIAPVVLSSSGAIEDSARRFPTVSRLARRVVLRQRQPDYRWADEPIEVDWVAGMFVVFPADLFRDIGGFDDERFFMYFEDVDICRRLESRDRTVVLNPAVRVVHDAQRASHRKLKHLRWHATSALRYLTGW